MVKQIEIFGPYDPIIRDMMDFLKRVGRRRSLVGKREPIAEREAPKKHKYYQTECCDLNNPRDAKFIFDLLYHSEKRDGKLHKSPSLNYQYFKYHGTPEQLAKAERDLQAFKDLEKITGEELEKEFESMKNKPEKLRKEFVFLDVRYFVEIRAEQAT